MVLLSLSEAFAEDVESFCRNRLKTIDTVRPIQLSLDASARDAMERMMEREKRVLRGLLDAMGDKA
jgi:hypothetical protein